MLRFWALCTALLLCIDVISSLPVVESIQLERTELTTSSDHYVLHHTPQKWSEALATCREDNSSLLVLGTKSELELMNDALETGIEYWVGLSDDDNEWQWAWVDDSNLNTSRIKFVENEVESDNPAMCTVYRREGSVFQNVSCHSKECYACYNGTFIMPEPFSYDNMEFHEKQRTWHDALHICRKRGWSLPTVVSLRDKGILDYYILYDDTSCSSWWIHHNEPEVMRWTQQENAAKILKMFVIPLIGDIQHNEAKIYDEAMCSAIKDGKVYEFPCDRKVPFICKINPSSSVGYSRTTVLLKIITALVFIMCATTIVGLIIMKTPACKSAYYYGQRSLEVLRLSVRKRLVANLSRDGHSIPRSETVYSRLEYYETTV